MYSGRNSYHIKLCCYQYNLRTSLQLHNGLSVSLENGGSCWQVSTTRAQNSCFGKMLIKFAKDTPVKGNLLLIEKNNL